MRYINYGGLLCEIHSSSTLMSGAPVEGFRCITIDSGGGIFGSVPVCDDTVLQSVSYYLHLRGVKKASTATWVCYNRDTEVDT